jgi:putative membrane protein
VTPVALLDILFVAAQNLGMLRDLATLYGGRPSTIATLKLARMAATHLAVTGGLAISDNLIQHFVGRGLLGKLSSRLGEGAVNGILTSRIGLAALAVCRPIPRDAATSESLTSLLREVLSFGDGVGKEGKG